MKNRIAIISLAIAGAVHLYIAPDHYNHAPAHGVFFALSGAAQVLWAILAWIRVSRTVTYVGLALSGGMIVLWLLTQLWTPPFAEMAEPIDIWMITSKIAELIGFFAIIFVESHQAGQREDPRIARNLLQGLSPAIVAGLIFYGGGYATEPMLPALQHAAGEAHNDSDDHHGDERNAHTEDEDTHNASEEDHHKGEDAHDAREDVQHVEEEHSQDADDDHHRGETDTHSDNEDAHVTDEDDHSKDEKLHDDNNGHHEAEATTDERHQEVAEKGAMVMPFDLEKTTHIFENSDNGGIQQVVVKDPDDAEQIELIRSHLATEAERFARGDFDDPAQIHGDEMPGLTALSAGADHITIEFSKLPDGAQIRYTSDKADLIEAIHLWFETQLADHGPHAVETR